MKLKEKDVLKIIILEDSAYFRKIIQHKIKRNKNIQVVGWIKEMNEAVNLIPEKKTPLIVVDLLNHENNDFEIYRMKTYEKDHLLILTNRIAIPDLYPASIESKNTDRIQELKKLAKEILDIKKREISYPKELSLL